MALLAFKMNVRNVDCTITDVAKEACEIAKRFQVPVQFKFNNIACEVHPNDTYENVVYSFEKDRGYRGLI